MKKICALLATFLVAGAANATVTIFTDNTTHAVTTNSDNFLKYNLAPQSGGVIVDYTFSFTSPLNNTNEFLGFWFNTATGSTSPNFGLKANCGATTASSCIDDVFGRTSGSGNNPMPNSDLSPNTTYHVMGYLYKTGNSSTYNNLDVWLDPTNSEMISLTGADLHATGSSGFSSFTDIGFRSANITSGLGLSVSDVRVAVVPEPTTLSLMGLAAACMGFLRRRKKA